MKLVEYRRVSTAKQGESGLGMEGQATAVAAYAKANDGEVVKTFTEVETGKRADRPELAKALAHCRGTRQPWLWRSWTGLPATWHSPALMESGVPFVACDQPTANRLTLHILAAVAEAEAKAISERTKAALAAYKARGGLLGGARPECRDNLTDAGRMAGVRASVESRARAAVDAYADLLPMMKELRADGLSLRAIAERLTADGFTTRRGLPWNCMQVKLVLDRAGG